MWTLRRASVQLKKNRGLSPSATRILNVNSEIGSGFLEKHDLATTGQRRQLFSKLFSLTRFYNTSSNCSKLHMGICSFSSQAGAKSTGEEDDDLEDAFSELEAPIGKDDDSISDPDLSENEGVESDLIDELEVLQSPRKSHRAAADDSGIAKAILAARSSLVDSVMDKWIEEGNEVTKETALLAMQHLRKRRLFAKALQLSEWLEATKKIDFGESYYASHLDLVAKVHGIKKAENYLKSIPESFRSIKVYGSLLANCVAAVHVKKSEALFNKIKDSGLPLTRFACNQMILLYKKVDRKKIADILSFMEKDNIKPTVFTYWLLIDMKGQSKDVKGMEQIVEKMKSEGFRINYQTQADLARHYIHAGLKDKAEDVLKELEGRDLEKTRWIYKLLLPIYASLKREEDVERIWKLCDESDTSVFECTAAIVAWGQLGKIENAEAAFERLLKIAQKPSPGLYVPMLNVYADHKMLTEGKDLMRRMMDRDCKVDSLTYDALVKLYVAAGEVEKANSMLDKANKAKGKDKPFFTTFYAVMEQYANRGSVRNAEEVFLKMREAGYAPNLRHYELLLNAYLNAKTPAYGFVERMKADNMFPNRSIAMLLAKSERLRNSTADDLLE